MILAFEKVSKMNQDHRASAIRCVMGELLIGFFSEPLAEARILNTGPLKFFPNTCMKGNGDDRVPRCGDCSSAQRSVLNQSGAISSSL